jgi:hypothetical protein
MHEKIFPLRDNEEMPPRRGGSKGLIATMRRMKIGQCFTYDGSRSAIHVAAKHAGIRVSYRKREDGKGNDIWRLA